MTNSKEMAAVMRIANAEGPSPRSAITQAANTSTLSASNANKRSRLGSGITLSFGDSPYSIAAVRGAALRPRDLRNPARALRTAGDENQQIDALGDKPRIRRNARFLHEAFKSQQRRLSAVGVGGGEAARVAGVPGLEQIQRLMAAHLADDDPIGAHAQHLAHVPAQVGRAARNPADDVAGLYLQLQLVLDDPEPLVGVEFDQSRDQRVEQRSIAGAGPAHRDDVVAPPDGLVDDRHLPRSFDEVLERPYRPPVQPDRKRGSV